MAEKAKPTIVFVPGIWEGPTVFTSLSTTLQALGYPTETATIPSTGTSSPGNPSMRDDEQAIRYIVKRLVIDEEKTVILVCHSAGGFLASGAIEGLSAKNLEKKGCKGGVAKFVFLTAGLAAEGYVHGKMPFMDFVVSCCFVSGLMELKSAEQGRRSQKERCTVSPQSRRCSVTLVMKNRKDG
jgi:pimeloyl-ACP methyl ester carboxylesterase